MLLAVLEAYDVDVENILAANEGKVHQAKRPDEPSRDRKTWYTKAGNREEATNKVFRMICLGPHWP